MAKDNAAETEALVTIRLSGAVLNLFPGASEQVELPAATVAEAIDGLNARWPGMRDRLCDTRPAIRRHINVFVNGSRARLDQPLPPGARLFIVTAITGG